MPRRAVNSLNHDLPARPRALSSDALSKVFGGCRGAGQTCTPEPGGAFGHGNCCTLWCQPFQPHPNWAGQWYCDVMAAGGE